MIFIAAERKNLSKRYFANVVDYVIILILTGAYIFIFGQQDEVGTYHVRGVKALVIPLIWFTYFPVCESSFGQTLGKKAFRLHVVDLEGEKPSIVHAFLRRMLDIFELMLFGVPALLVINHSQKNQRIGDMIAGTSIVTTDAVCNYCSVELELSTREVLRETFTCPNCQQVNCSGDKLT
jgi:uncharacterized RDD family membrane protein YckC